MGYFYHTVWPWIKVRGRFYWWVIKYRGAKNIPQELIFSAMAKSMARMNENLQMALRSMPEDASDEERDEFWELLGQASQIEKDVEQIKMEKRLKSMNAGKK